MFFRGFPRVFHLVPLVLTRVLVAQPTIYRLIHTYSRLEIILTRLLFAVGFDRTNLSQQTLVLVVPVRAVVS
jgi:hypothetical protein